MELKEFFSKLPSPHSEPFSSDQCQHTMDLQEEVRQAASRGLKLFPVSQLAKLTGNPDLLIGEATSDLSRLEELVADSQPMWGYRLAVGPSGLCIWRMDQSTTMESLAALAPDLDECLSLQACCGTAALTLFQWPQGLVLRPSARKLVPGLSILGDGDSCIIPPSGGYVWRNPWAEIEALPHALLDLAFEPTENPPGRSVPVPTPSLRLPACRPAAHLPKPQRGASTVYPTRNQSGWRGKYRLSRRR